MGNMKYRRRDGRRKQDRRKSEGGEGQNVRWRREEWGAEGRLQEKEEERAVEDRKVAGGWKKE